MKALTTRRALLGVGASEPIPLLPEVPTMAEPGTPVDAANRFGLLGPARMPPEIAPRIAQVAAEGLRSPAVQEVFRTQAAIPVTSTPAEMRTFIAADRERWAVLVRDLNIRLE